MTQKKKLSKKAISLICAVIALVFLCCVMVYFLNTSPPPKDLTTSSPEPEISLCNKPITDIETIKVQREGDEFEISLKPGTDATYYISKLEAYPRQENRYTSATKAIATLSAQKLIASSADNISQYGLDKPQTKITYKFKSEEPKKLLIGNISPDETGVYICYEGQNEVYLSSSLVKNSFTVGSAEYISSTLVDAVSNDNQPVVKSLELGGTFRKEKLTLIHTPTSDSSPIGATEYTITSPIENYIDADYSQKLFANIFGIFGSKVVAYGSDKDMMKKYGLDNPYSSLKVVYEGGEYQINIGNSTKDYYYASVAGRDIVYELAKSTIIWAELTFEQLHSKSLFIPSITEVKELIIKHDAGEYIFMIKPRDSSNSTALDISCNGKEIDEENFKKLYQVIISTKADERASKITDKHYLLEYTFKFHGKTPDLNVKFFTTTARKAAAEIDGNTNFQVSMTYIDKIINDIDNLFAGNPINVDWS